MPLLASAFFMLASDLGRISRGRPCHAMRHSMSWFGPRRAAPIVQKPPMHDEIPTVRPAGYPSQSVRVLAPITVQSDPQNQASQPGGSHQYLSDLDKSTGTPRVVSIRAYSAAIVPRGVFV